jgi:hypothetical protein
MLAALTDMADTDRPNQWLHGEKKTFKQFAITKTASDKIDVLAKRFDISRSEVIERILRINDVEDLAKDLEAFDEGEG